MPHLKLQPSCREDALLYAHSLDAPERVLYNKEPFSSNDYFLRSALINGELPDSMPFCYREVEDIDSRACVNLLIHERHLLKKRLSGLSLDRIYNGPPRRKLRVDITLIKSSFLFLSVGRSPGEFPGGGFFLRAL